MSDRMKTVNCSKSFRKWFYSSRTSQCRVYANQGKEQFCSGSNQENIYCSSFTAKQFLHHICVEATFQNSLPKGSIPTFSCNSVLIYQSSIHYRLTSVSQRHLILPPWSCLYFLASVILWWDAIWIFTLCFLFTLSFTFVHGTWPQKMTFV